MLKCMIYNVNLKLAGKSVAQSLPPNVYFPNLLSPHVSMKNGGYMCERVLENMIYIMSPNPISLSF